MENLKNMEYLEKLEQGKNPGLGIRELHEKGITGKGVNVAIIDQKLRLTHEEYKDRIKSYTEVEDVTKENYSMHGPAVSSLLCGKSCGVAPETSLYYYTHSSAGPNLFGYAKALKLINERNNLLDADNKIKVISVSRGFRDIDDTLGLHDLEKELKVALESGVFTFIINDRYKPKNMIAGGSKGDKDDPKSYELAINLKHIEHKLEGDKIIFPIDYRSYASRLDDTSYVYEEEGGVSWGMPYLAGIAALALQIKPNLKYEDFKGLIDKTATKIQGKFRVINPTGIIESL